MKPRPLFWASLSNAGRRSEAMREGMWKLVVHHPKAKPGTFQNESIELYNLQDDPVERNDFWYEEKALLPVMSGQNETGK